MNDIDDFYLGQEEPNKSCLLALRDIILEVNEHISPAWKYGMPFFTYKGKMFVYLWVRKNTMIPYIGIVEGKKIEHPSLIAEKRSRMKIMLIDPNKDLPLKTIRSILGEAMKLYQKG
jgi:hypothetical protein